MLLYRLTFPNGKSYIGITSGAVKRRVLRHVSQAKEGRRSAVSQAIRKYGTFETVVLAVAGDWSYLCDLEQRAISAFGTLAPNGYNLTLGGEGVLGVKRTKEQREAHGAAVRGKGLGNKHALGYRHTKEARERISSAGVGRIFSDESRSKIGAAKVGNRYGVGRSMSKEARLASSEKQKGRPKSAEARALMSAAKKGKPWSAARRAAQKAKSS